MGKKRESDILNNAKWLILYNIANSIISVFLTAVMSRYLGPDNWGKLSYATSLISIFAAVSNLGIDSILVAEIVNNRKKEGTVIGTALVLKFIASLISFLCLIIFLVVVNNNDKIILIIVLLQGISLLFQGYHLLGEWFLANLCSKYYVIAVLFGVICSSVLKLGLVWENRNVFYFAIVTTIESIVTFFMCFIFFLKVKNFKLKINANVAKDILNKSWYFIISNIAIVIYTQIDKVMLNNMTDDYTVGLYSAGSTIAHLWIFVPNAYVNSWKSKILGKWGEKSNEAKIELKRLTRKVMFLCGAFAICVSIAGKLIIYILYGNDYLGSYPIMIILTWASVFAIYGTLGTIWILGEGVNKYSSIRTAIGAIINVVLDFIAIPRFGMCGAAWATLISQICVTCFCMLIWKETRGFIKISKK